MADVKQKKIYNIYNNVSPYIYFLNVAKVDLSSIVTVILNFNNSGLQILVSGFEFRIPVFWFQTSCVLGLS